MSTELEDKDEVVDEEEEEDEEDLEKLEAEILRMEKEAALINKKAEEEEEGEDKADDAGDESKESGTAKLSAQANQDAKSVYVGQVDYSTTPEELVKHFEACGTLERVTIMTDKFTGQPKGFAYIEFENESSVETALKLDGSDFKGRQLKVTRKRVNQPGMTVRGGRGVRGRGPSGRGAGRGPPGRGGGSGYRGGFRGGRGRAGGFRGGRGRAGGYHPYY